MTNILKKVSTVTLTLAATALLAACSNTCGGHHRMDTAKKHHRDYGTHQPVMVYEAEAVEVVEMQPMARQGMKAQMYTRNGTGGTSPMGYVKFKQDDGCVKMMVDLTDLRPGKDYKMKIYQCGDCGDFNCCESRGMDLNLPTVSVSEPGRFTKTYKINDLDCSDLKNAKVVLTRDGGYQASWGRVQPIMK